jgi:hypothetical protein
MFESVESSAEVDSEVESDYELAIQGIANASFPKISNLTSLASVHFKGIHDKTTAYFAETLLQATTTSSLCHLFFCPIRQPNNVQKEIGAFRIFEYLEQTPRLTKNLKSFGFSIAHYSTDPEEVSVRFGCEPCGFIKFVNRNASPLKPLQFCKKLTTLFWDSPYHLDDQFLPGVLTSFIASSLVQLYLNNGVENLGETNPPYPRKISFPNFPRLRSLKLGFHAAKSLSVPDLIHSAPNLASFEVKADLTGRRPWDMQIQYFILVWRGIIKQSVSHPEHCQIRIFCTDIPFKRLTDLQMVLSKFPNLEQLCIDTVEDVVHLESFLNSIKSTHPQLQKLSWTFNAELTVHDLCHHFLRLPEVLPALTSYSLEISFPNFPRLRSLKLGFHAAKSLSVPDLIHSAPNLASFEVKLDLTGRRHYNRNYLSLSSVWEGIIEELVSLRKHSQLRIFCTDISFERLSDLRGILSKFPNLVELRIRIGKVEDVDDPDSFLNSIKSTHPKLQRLSWTFTVWYHTLNHLFRHLIRLPEDLPALELLSRMVQ